ncbi:hypothetical protein FRC06_009477 [Ceratobasidium sp. 370]|nr:hypothetical protein FRC06_009477 [Ceratobasidium sp. 370]
MRVHSQHEREGHIKRRRGRRYNGDGKIERQSAADDYDSASDTENDGAECITNSIDELIDDVQRDEDETYTNNDDGENIAHQRFPWSGGIPLDQLFDYMALAKARTEIPWLQAMWSSAANHLEKELAAFGEIEAGSEPGKGGL